LATAAPEPAAPAPLGPERFISVKEAAARLGVSPKWLYRRKKTLPFMREVAPGTWRVSEPALDRWMHNRGRL
jgi:excisionase family DNA binding protein